jgi:hypothetical protein
MKYCLSLSLIPSRIDNFIKYIYDYDNHIKSRLVIINVCGYYKRLNTNFKLQTDFLQFLKIINSKYSYQKYVLNFSYDYGPATKLIGGVEYIKKKNINVEYLIICDDDTFLHQDLLDMLCDEKYKYNGLTTGSGFDFDKNNNYKIVCGACEMVEGYGGICFEQKDFDNKIFDFFKFYKIIEFKIDDNLINQFLKSCFLGDDCIISNFYQNKKSIKNGRKYINPMDYGFNDDALHRNNVFGSNMLSYKFFRENKTIFETFKNKIKLNYELKSNEDIKTSS